MKFTFTDKKVNIPNRVHTYAEKKIGKLDRYFQTEPEASIVFSVEKGRNNLEVTIRSGATVIRVAESTSDMFVSIDAAVASIERQLRKYKNKIVQREQGGGSFRQEFIDKEAEDEEVRIIRTKQYDLKPMYPEDACVQMEMLGHSFYVFVNAETDQVNVVYKRKGNTYGLLEPEK